VHLIADALLEHGGSGRKSFQRSIQAGELRASEQAAYGKLRRVPLSLSIGWLFETSAQLQAVYPSRLRGVLVPASLRGMEVTIYDGKTLKYVARRLKALQKVRGGVLGGQLVVALSLSTGLVVAMGADEDGESGEQPLVPSVLEQVREAFADSVRLHVADRGFCDLVQMARFSAEGDHFLVRWNRRLKFTRDEGRAVQAGVDGSGRAYWEEWGWAGTGARRRYVRRIHLSVGPESEELVVATDLLDSESYPAADLLTVYRRRWGIERVFQQVTEVFHLKHLIGSTARATVFQAAFCFVLYNMIEVIRAYIAEGAGREIETVSLELLFYDVHRQLVAWNELLSPEETLAYFSAVRRKGSLAACLRDLLHGQWSDLWIKSPSNTHRAPPAQRKHRPNSGHISVYRALRQAFSPHS